MISRPAFFVGALRVPVTILRAVVTRDGGALTLSAGGAGERLEIVRLDSGTPCAHA
jgi:hypothetical protein